MPKPITKVEKSEIKSKKSTAHRKAKAVGKKLVGSKKNKSKKVTAIRKKKLSKDVLRRRVKRVFKSKTKFPRGVVYLGHVPHGFYEDEMRQFFTQFGKVTNINIPRSDRTGKYRGYAFVEFQYQDVAKIVAETMNNYLMFQKVLQAKYIPPNEQKPICFRLRKYKTPLLVRRRKFLRRQNYRVLSNEKNDEVVARLHKNLEKKKRKLQKLELNYEFMVTNNEPCAVKKDADIIQNESCPVENDVGSKKENVRVSPPNSIKKKRRVSSK